MTTVRASAFLAAVASFLAMASAQTTLPAHPANPTADAADPTTVRDGDYWYVYTTGQGILARRTKDFVNWEILPTVFKDAVPAWAKQTVPQTTNVWAPDIAKVGDRYLMLYHCSYWGSQHSVMGVVSAKTLDPKSPDYGWTDHGLLIESKPGRDDFNAIDGSIAIDAGGKPWIVWGSYWTGIKVARLSDDGLKVIDIDKRASVAREAHGPEGSQITYHNGWYYLLCSYAGGPDYQVRVGRSREITGPYLDRRGRDMMDGGGTPVTKASPGVVGPGHHSLALGDDRFGDLLLCHVFNRYSRDLYVATLLWDNDGWPVAGEAYRPAGPAVADVKAHLINNRWISILDGAHIGTNGYRWLTFTADGKVESVTASNAKAAGTWSLDGRQLTMKWPAPKAPNGAWSDVVTISADGTHFAGRNDNDTDVRGSLMSLNEWSPR